MKRLIYLALVIGLFFVTSTSESRAETYLGDFCLQIDITSSGGIAISKIGVYEKEGGHYALYGRVLDNNLILNGNAEIDGSNLLITFVLSGTDNIDGDKSGDIWNAVIDISTLSGTFFMLGIHRTPTGEVGNHYDYGTMTLITCP